MILMASGGGGGGGVTGAGAKRSRGGRLIYNTVIIILCVKQQRQHIRRGEGNTRKSTGSEPLSGGICCARPMMLLAIAGFAGRSISKDMNKSCHHRQPSISGALYARTLPGNHSFTANESMKHSCIARIHTVRYSSLARVYVCWLFAKYTHHPRIRKSPQRRRSYTWFPVAQYFCAVSITWESSDPLCLLIRVELLKAVCPHVLLWFVDEEKGCRDRSAKQSTVPLKLPFINTQAMVNKQL